MTLNVPDHPPSTLRIFLTATAIVGTCIVILMAMAAFGPSGFGFGVVIATLLFGFMLRRYRFSLRTFLILTTLLGVWLGLKVNQTPFSAALTGSRFSCAHPSPNRK